MKPDASGSDLRLVAQARAVRERAYAPYSGFQVGAALLGRDGRCFTAVNVENASYGLTICAERAAVAQAVAAGCREFAAIAVVAGGPGPVAPCGACRQVLREFAPDLRVVMAGPGDAGDVGDTGEAGNAVQVRTLRELLPDAFGPEHLGR